MQNSSRSVEKTTTQCCPQRGWMEALTSPHPLLPWPLLIGYSLSAALWRVFSLYFPLPHPTFRFLFLSPAALKKINRNSIVLVACFPLLGYVLSRLKGCKLQSPLRMTTFGLLFSIPNKPTERFVFINLNPILID